MSVEVSAQRLEVALWFRHVCRIDTGSDDLVPHLLDYSGHELNGPAYNAVSPVAAEWREWWQALIERRDHPTRPPDSSFDPPQFEQLQRWPALRELVLARWQEAYEWSNQRSARPATDSSFALEIDQAVASLQRNLNRPVRNFSLCIVLLPVLDDRVIRVPGTSRYLLAARLMGGPGGKDVLREIIRAHA